MKLDLEADLADLLQQITDIYSVSDNETELANAVEQTLQDYAHLEVIRNGDAVIARTQLGRDRRVLIAGHLDTVPVANNLPSERREVDGEDRIYGRGTCDMKGGVAVQLKAAATLSNPANDITWVFYDHEEVDGIYNGLGRIANELPQLLVADFALLGEPTGAVIEGGCQGTMRFSVTTTGVAAHSARAWLGHNAIHDIAAVIEKVANYPVGEVTVDGLVYREGLNVVAISGGIAGNVIPDTCSVEINYRYAPNKSTDDALAEMQKLFAGYELKVNDLQPGARPGLDIAIAKEFVSAVGGVPRAKYGWTDVARFSGLGIPAVNYGPADPSKAHADDEYCPVQDLYRCYEAMKQWLENDEVAR
ncbi:MAG: succinyl-diaminopimelate desuccinylase [Actinomycetales bacterium]|nr:MAG: succinyl-diaminopimelate desuccinylase [Actinomycetales bacterium]